MIVGADLEWSREAKRCRKCMQTKPINAFHRDATKGDGFHNQCKDCRCARETIRYDNNRDVILIKQKKNPTKRRNTWLRYKYGISLEDYDGLFLEQGGRCAICRVEEPILSVDHDHETERIRGLLCRVCNSVLGLFEENLNRFAEAAAYLERGGFRGHRI